MGLWKSKRPPRTSWPSKPDMQDQSPVLARAPVWSPHPNAMVYTHARPFNMGAAAFAYSLHGLPAYAPLPGYNNRFQFKSMQPPSDVYAQSLLRNGLGQSFTSQPPSPGADKMYTVSQLDALIQAATAGGTSYFGG